MFWPTVTILIMSLFRFLARLPFMGTFQVCRKGFARASSHVLVGAVVLIIRSMTTAYVGHVGEKLR